MATPADVRFAAASRLGLAHQLDVQSTNHMTWDGSYAMHPGSVRSREPLNHAANGHRGMDAWGGTSWVSFFILFFFRGTFGGTPPVP
jgi:hypothetical protein